MAFKLGNIQVFPNNYYFNFMRWRKVTVGLSLVLVVLSLFVVGIKGLNYSIDFLGGTEIQLNIPAGESSRNELDNIIKENGYKNFELTTLGALNVKQNQSSYVIRIQREKNQNENAVSNHTAILIQKLKQHFGDKIQVASTTSISGKVGKEDERKGYWALIISCVGILVYIGLRFDARFSPGAVLCLLHNVILALGFMTFLGRPFTTASIAAFLTIVGYTINDTVIVYDRIRETRILQPKLPMIEIVNRSISQTMNRTILTSVTAVAALLVLSVLGGGTIEDFALTMLVGVIVGTYSSIYVAAPLTLMMDKWLEKFKIFKHDSNQQVKEQKPKDYAPPIRIRK